MDWQFLSGLGTAIVAFALAFAVRDMPAWTSWSLVACGVLLMAWGLIPDREKIPVSVGLLFVAGVMIATGAARFAADKYLAAPKARRANAAVGQEMIVVSQRILEWIVDRERYGPSPIPRKDSWTEDTARYVEYSLQTEPIFSKQFGTDVVRLRNEAKERGFVDEDVERFYQHPTSPIGVRVLAVHLGALGQRMTQITRNSP